jgi:hypothetical protein
MAKKQAPPMKAAPKSLAAKMKAGKGISNGVKPGKQRTY